MACWRAGRGTVVRAARYGWLPRRDFRGDSDPVELVREGPRPDADLQRKEALRLYRDVIRSARHFTWTDKDGVVWRDKLIASARKEFEDARHERDPDIIARLLIGGQEALIAITDRMLLKARKLVDEEAKAPSTLGNGWVDGASVGAASGAIPFGASSTSSAGNNTGAIPFGADSGAQRRTDPSGGGASGGGGAGGEARGAGAAGAGRMGQQEGKRADELAWKRDWQARHQGGGAAAQTPPLPPLRSPWSAGSR